MGWSCRALVGVLSLVAGACGPAVIVPQGESSSAADDDTTTSTTTTGPGTTVNPSTTIPGTTADPSAPQSSTGPDPDTDDDDPNDGTTTPTTAGEDGGTPGGAGPDGAPDEPGDVGLPEADVIAAAVYTDGTMVDFRVQLATAPFGVEATYDITWCIATGSGTGSCATHAENIDDYLQVFFYQDGVIEVQPAELDACLHGAFETETNTLRILVPIDVFPGTADFEWILTVTYGGSFGNNEWTPEDGALDVVIVDALPPFSGEATCG